MYALVAIGPNCDSSIADNPKRFVKLCEVKFGNIPVRFGVSNIAKPSFDPQSERDRDFVLVRVSAFSCNYRDKGLLLFNLESNPDSIIPFGSEFSGTIVSVGAGVEDFHIGDRVMPESAYPEGPAEGISPGVATNFASQGWLRLHHGKLTKVPDSMDDLVAASFTLGAQTAMGMIRRSGILQEGGKPVVFSSRSATSLFVTKFLANHGFKPVCLTTSDWTPEERRLIEPATLIKIDRDNPTRALEGLSFTHVFDPFVDMNLPLGAEILELGGTYTTCGFLNQHPELYGESTKKLGLGVQVGLQNVIIKNLRIQGNCLGFRSDLERALNIATIHGAPFPVEREFSFADIEGFINESFFDRSKLGKVVMQMRQPEPAE